MTDQGTSSVPPITDDMRRAARRQPGSWLYVVDPAFDPAGEVPPEGIVGAYPVDDAGDLGEEFTKNPRYRPTPLALRLPEPTDPLDALVQRAATGWAAESALVDELAGSSLWLLAGPSGEIFVVDDDGDRRSVWVFTSPVHAERPAPGHALQQLSARQVLEAIPEGVDLVVNPGAAASVRIPFSDFEAAARRRDE